MKNLSRMLALLSLFAGAALLQGCYTRVMSTDGEETYSPPTDSTGVASGDTVYDDLYYHRPLYHVGFDYYYPSWAYYSPYDPWFSYDPYYNPWWWCGTPYVVYRYPYYAAYPRLAFAGYGYYGFGARYAYAPGYSYPIRTSGVRRSGVNRTPFGQTYVGTRGSVTPTGVEAGARASGAVRSGGYNRSAFAPSRGVRSAPAATSYRRSGARMAPYSARPAPQGSRSQGAVRSAPNRSYAPRSAPPAGPSRSAPSGGGGGGHRGGGGGGRRGR